MTPIDGTIFYLLKEIYKITVIENKPLTYKSCIELPTPLIGKDTEYTESLLNALNDQNLIKYTYKNEPPEKHIEIHPMATQFTEKYYEHYNSVINHK